MKVLLADSEQENLKNFKNFLRITYPDINNVSVLSNSEKNIFERLREDRPDLIVADIRFFGVTCYQTVRNINELYPEIKLILYGTYNDADYLKRTLDFGVVNYMFKPVKPIEFKKSMDNAIKIIKTYDMKKKEEDLLKSEYLEAIELFQDKFFNNVLFGNVKNEKEIYRSFEYFKLDFKNNFCVFTIRVDYFKKIILTLDEMEKHMLIYKTLNVVNKGLKNEVGKAIITNFNSISVVLSGDIDLESVINLCTKIKNNIYDTLQIRVTIGIGRIYKTPSDLSVSLKEADAALRYRFYNGYNSIIPISFVEPNNNITYRYPLDKENRLVYATVIGEYEYCQILVDEIFTALKDSGELPEKLVPKIIMNILISISRYASEQNIMLNSRFATYFSFKEALEVTDLEEGKKYLLTAIYEFCNYVVSVHAEKDLELFEKAKAYVDLRYYENTPLLKIAVSLDTTVDYINNIFVEKLNKSFIEYIIFKRIEISKTLLLEGKLDDETIAVKIGFDEGKQFRNAFRQIEGIFPHEYKNTFRKI